MHLEFCQKAIQFDINMCCNSVLMYPSMITKEYNNFK